MSNDDLGATPSPDASGARPHRKKLGDLPTWVLAVLAIGVLGVVVVGLLAVNAIRTPGQAKEACREGVQDQLKSPSSARFSDEEAEETGEGRYLVTGSVDSENGFGAMIRNDYACKVSETAGSWRAYSVTFDGE